MSAVSTRESDSAAAMANYQEVFRLMGLVALGVAALLLVLSPFLKRMMHLDKQIEEVAHGS